MAEKRAFPGKNEAGRGGGAVLIAGPTASGKSALAAALAERFGGTVINADSMQVYRDLRILTARPDAALEARVPHRLFGHVDGATAYSTGAYAADAAAALAEARTDGRLPIFAGGTGLYFRALTEGLAPVPEIPDAVRAAARAHVAENGPEAAYEKLAARDPASAALIEPSDPQRLSRAFELLEATGRGFAAWRAERGRPVLEGPAAKIVLTLDRETLYARCDVRFERMIAAGALEEVAALRDRGLDPALPVMKALGVPQLLAVLEGAIPLPDAADQAERLTRRYAKRQMTWMRTQMPGWECVDALRPDLLDCISERVKAAFSD
jgi:tRNA dimethylallyltransferase